MCTKKRLLRIATFFILGATPWFRLPFFSYTGGTCAFCVQSMGMHACCLFFVCPSCCIKIEKRTCSCLCVCVSVCLSVCVYVCHPPFPPCPLSLSPNSLSQKRIKDQEDRRGRCKNNFFLFRPSHGWMCPSLLSQLILDALPLSLSFHTLPHCHNYKTTYKQHKQTQ